MAPRRRPNNPPQWSEVKPLFHLRTRDAAAQLGVSESYLKIFCRKNGIPRWPGPKIRSLTEKLRLLEMEAEEQHGALPGQAGNHRPRQMILRDISEVAEEMARIRGISNPPPGGLPEHGDVADAESATDSGAHP